MNRKRLSTIVLLLVLATAGVVAQEHKKVLFVGNSYTSVNNLPQMTAQVAASMGDTLDFTTSAPGGCTLQQHCSNGSMTLIRQGGWDAVVLQEQSLYPAFPDWQVQQDVFPYAERLVDSIYACSPCAEPMFYMTWGRKNGDAYNAPSFPPIGTYEGMDSLLCLRYTQMAEQNDASLCPVGRVWHRLRNTHPEIELYQSDESHPSVAGTYAAACSFYTMLFHHAPDAHAYDAGLQPEVAEAIREAVRAVVADSLTRWQRPQPWFELIGADYAYKSYPQQFYLYDVVADTVFCDWGDGTVDTMSEGYVFSHVYADNVLYDIIFTAKKHCMTFVETVQSFDPTGMGMDPMGSARIKASPNPATDKVRLTLPQGGGVLTLVDVEGRMVMHRRVADAEVVLSVGTLPCGVYLLRADTDEGTATCRLIVR